MLSLSYRTQRTSCWGYHVLTRPSVSPVLFLVSTTPKTAQKISWNFVVIKDVMCRCAYLQEILIVFFFLGVMPLLNLEIWPKLNILLKQFVNATPLKVPNRKSWNVVIVYIHWKYWFDFFLRELSELWPKHTISCNLYETSLAYSHIFIEWRRSCWGRYLWQWTSKCYTNVTIINQLCVSDYYQSQMHGIAILYVQHCHAMLKRGVCELAHFFFHC